MARRILDVAHCSVATTDSRQERRFVVAPSRGGVRRRLGFTPPGAAAPGNSGHLGCLITVYPFAQWRERVNRYICIYSVYVDKDLLLCYTENANK